jgi:putative membrane protein
VNPDDATRSEAVTPPGRGPTPDEPLLPGRTLLGGFFMGLANLVPGISGGTIILAIGLYDRFIGAIADVTRLRFTRSSISFLALMVIGAVAAVAAFSGLAVDLIRDHRWVAYSLFVGMTLGGVPLLLKLCRPLKPGVVVGFAAGFGLMLAQFLDYFSTTLPEGMPWLALAGALGATSMVLPGISGAYVLLLLGVYELIIGSLSVSAVRADPGGTLSIVLPVAVGAGLGIGLLSNLLKWLLARFSATVHGALLGLLVGSVLGLYPFQQSVDPALAHKAMRKSVALLVEGVEPQEVRGRYGLELPDAEVERLVSTYEGLSGAELKRRGDALERFTPSAGGLASSLGLLALGFLFTRLLGRKSDD